jgi:hypothetical protein
MSDTRPADQPPDILACESSLFVNEDLFASAPRAEVWLLLEYNGVWGAKALEESDLAEPIKQRLFTCLDAIPASRFQFIKRERTPETITFYIALANDLQPALYHFELNDYEELLTLDVQSIVAGDAAYDGQRSGERLHLVCTNGRRDVCCAKFGPAICQAMTAYAAEAVWQTTHLGGHRFAATAVFLPQGIVYGRILPHQATVLIDAHRRGHIDLDHLRGRSCYAPVAQAAEYYLRRETGVTALDHFHLMRVEEVKADEAWVVFAAIDGGMYRVRVIGQRSDFRVRESSSKAKWSQVDQYRFVELKRGD